MPNVQSRKQTIAIFLATIFFLCVIIGVQFYFRDKPYTAPSTKDNLNKVIAAAIDAEKTSKSAAQAAKSAQQAADSTRETANAAVRSDAAAEDAVKNTAKNQ